MDYYLYKLKFDGAVHFGQSESALSLYTTADHFRADTLFSALCHTALSLWGEDGVQELVKQAEADELLLFRSVANGKENGGLVLDEGIDDSRMGKEKRRYS